jgi:hypothetical protein
VELAACEGRDEVTSSQYIRRVNEIERDHVIQRKEPQGIEAYLALSTARWDPLTPPHVYVVDSARKVVFQSWTDVLNIRVVDTDNPSVAELMAFSTIRGCQHHDITMIAVWVENILGAANIVRCVIDAKHVVLIYTIALE